MLAFIHMPKAAGTTLSNILRRNFGRRHFDTRFFSNRPVFMADDFRRVRWLYPSLVSIAGHGVTGTSDLAEVVPNIRYFTFLRDPLARLLSQYQFNWNCMPDSERSTWKPDEYFEQVILTKFNNVQSRMLAGDDGADAAIEFLQSNSVFVGMTESYNESLVRFRDWTGIEDFDIRYRSVNRTSDISNDLRDAMKWRIANDHKLADRVALANRDDIRLYDFACEMYAEQRRAYGHRLSGDVANFLDSQADNMALQDEQLSSQLYRNLVYKPLRKWIFKNAA
ncbi:MAG: sulfotransferase family 2 domain-containing protein [Planctomycetales bacterium]|nr:sulfotransferase family 2 domain-containing protein [Planctomycetales bacterium]